MFPSGSQIFEQWPAEMKFTWLTTYISIHLDHSCSYCVRISFNCFNIEYWTKIKARKHQQRIICYHHYRVYFNLQNLSRTFFCRKRVCLYLKVLISQVDLQPKRVDTLRQRPGQQICQRVGGLTQPGQHVFDQDDLVADLRLLTAHEKRKIPADIKREQKGKKKPNRWKPTPRGLGTGAGPRLWTSSTYPLCDLSDVLPVLPAGEHVGEGERLQACVDQVRFRWLPFVFLCCSKPKKCLINLNQANLVKVEVKPRSAGHT